MAGWPRAEGAPRPMFREVWASPARCGPARRVVQQPKARKAVERRGVDPAPQLTHDLFCPFILTNLSPGILYSFITKAFGFRPARHEGKITGLAAYGDPDTCVADFRALLEAL